MRGNEFPHQAIHGARGHPQTVAATLALVDVLSVEFIFDRGRRVTGDNQRIEVHWHGRAPSEPVFLSTLCAPQVDFGFTVAEATVTHPRYDHRLEAAGEQ